MYADIAWYLQLLSLISLISLILSPTSLSSGAAIPSAAASPRPKAGYGATGVGVMVTEGTNRASLDAIIGAGASIGAQAKTVRSFECLNSLFSPPIF